MISLCQSPWSILTPPFWQLMQWWNLCQSPMHTDGFWNLWGVFDIDWCSNVGIYGSVGEFIRWPHLVESMVSIYVLMCSLWEFPYSCCCQQFSWQTLFHCLSELVLLSFVTQRLLMICIFGVPPWILNPFPSQFTITFWCLVNGDSKLPAHCLQQRLFLFKVFTVAKQIF